jgi:hypothetical protein
LQSACSSGWTPSSAKPTTAGGCRAIGKVAVAAIVGNEDGAHSVTADLFQALNDEGWTIPAGGACYWVGEAMQKTDFKDLDEVPEKVARDARRCSRRMPRTSPGLLKHSKAYPGSGAAKT